MKVEEADKDNSNERRERKKKKKDRIFFFNDTATTEIYTLSLHDALPISGLHGAPTYSEHTAKEIDLEVRRLIDEQGIRVREILIKLQPVLLTAAEKLLSKEVMTGEELQALLTHKQEEPVLQ